MRTCLAQGSGGGATRCVFRQRMPNMMHGLVYNFKGARTAPVCSHVVH